MRAAFDLTHRVKPKTGAKPILKEQARYKPKLLTNNWNTDEYLAIRNYYWIQDATE